MKNDFYDTKTRKLTAAKWLIKKFDCYCFAENKRCYNRKTGIEIKQCLVGYTRGYYLNSKFVSLKVLKTLLFKRHSHNNTCF